MLGNRGVDRAQVILSMVKDDGTPLLSDPRQVLAHIVEKLQTIRFRPRVAIELEFNLFKKPGEGESLRQALPSDNETGGNLYGLSALDEHAELLQEVKEAFLVQGLPFDGVLKEAAPAQYEVNVAYADDPLLYCDQIIRMQRCIRAVAERFGSIASFMPKPMENQAGNGMHLHCCWDDEGNNVFDSGDVKGIVFATLSPAALSSWRTPT